MIDIHHLPGSDLQETQFNIYRVHPITLVPFFLSMIIVCVLPFAGYAALNYLHPEILADESSLAFFMIGASLFFLFGLLFLYQVFVDYWLDVFIVTDKRILDIEQTGLFSRTVSELRLHRIQDVTTEVTGFLHTFLDYGNISIQTAGEVEHFTFENLEHPNRLAKIILDLADADRRGQLDAAVEEFGIEKK